MTEIDLFNRKIVFCKEDKKLSFEKFKTKFNGVDFAPKGVDVVWEELTGQKIQIEKNVKKEGAK